MADPELVAFRQRRLQELKAQRIIPLADPELEAIRQRRVLQELNKAQQCAAPDSNETPEQKKAREEEAKRHAEELRQLNLSRVFTPEARSKLARMHPAKTRLVESIILQMDEMGVFPTKVSDEKLLSVIEKIKVITSREIKTLGTGVADDPELEAIRSIRLQELFSKGGVRKNAGLTYEQWTNLQKKVESQPEQTRQLNLSQILKPSAKELLDQFTLIDPSKAKIVGTIILVHDILGLIPDKVSDAELVSTFRLVKILTQRKINIESKRSQATQNISVRDD